MYSNKWYPFCCEWKEFSRSIGEVWIWFSVQRKVCFLISFLCLVIQFCFCRLWVLFPAGICVTFSWLWAHLWPVYISLSWTDWSIFNFCWSTYFVPISGFDFFWLLLSFYGTFSLFRSGCLNWICSLESSKSCDLMNPNLWHWNWC